MKVNTEARHRDTAAMPLMTDLGILLFVIFAITLIACVWG